MYSILQGIEAGVYFRDAGLDLSCLLGFAACVRNTDIPDMSNIVNHRTYRLCMHISDDDTGLQASAFGGCHVLAA